MAPTRGKVFSPGERSAALRGRIQTLMVKPRTLPSSLPSLLPLRSPRRVRLTPFWLKLLRPGPVIYFTNAPCFVPARRCLCTGCDEAYSWKKSLRPAPSGAVYAAPQHQHQPYNPVFQPLFFSFLFFSLEHNNKVNTTRYRKDKNSVMSPTVRTSHNTGHGENMKHVFVPYHIWIRPSTTVPRLC